MKCTDGTSPEIRNKVISGVVGAASSVTSIQVANLLRLFKIPQVCAEKKIKKLLFMYTYFIYIFSVRVLKTER